MAFHTEKFCSFTCCTHVISLCLVSVLIQALLQNVTHLLTFATGNAAIPSLGLSEKSLWITSLLARRPPETETCFNVVLLPTIHDHIEHFFAAFDKALLLGREGFSKIIINMLQPLHNHLQES